MDDDPSGYVVGKSGLQSDRRHPEALMQKTVQPSGVNCIREIEDVTSLVNQMECGKGI